MEPRYVRGCLVIVGQAVCASFTFQEQGLNTFGAAILTIVLSNSATVAHAQVVKAQKSGEDSTLRVSRQTKLH